MPFQAANVSMNVSNLQAQTVDKLRERLQLGPTSIPRLAPDGGRAVQRSVSMPVDMSPTPSPLRGSPLPASPLPARYANVKPRQASESQVQTQAPPGSPHFPTIPSEYIDDNPPPPTPPKKDPNQSPGRASSVMARSISASPDMARRRAATYFSDGDEVVIQPGRSSGIYPGITPRVLSPEAKARQRLEAQKKRAQEELQAQKEEEARQARLKREKEAALRQAEKEETLRKMKLEEEKRHALAERARREREAQMEEEHRLQEIETRRRQERERRMLYARRLEEEKLENERRAAEATRRREEQRKVSDTVKQQRMAEIQAKYASFGVMNANAVMYSGNVSVQTSAAMSWKRRYFELTGTAISFYRDSRVRVSVSPYLRDVHALKIGQLGAFGSADAQ